MLSDKTNTFAEAATARSKKAVKFANDVYSTPKEGGIKGYYGSTMTPLSTTKKRTKKNCPEDKENQRQSLLDTVEGNGECLSIFSEWQSNTKSSAFRSEAKLEHYMHTQLVNVSAFSIQGVDNSSDEEEKSGERPVGRRSHRLSLDPPATPNSTILPSMEDSRNYSITPCNPEALNMSLNKLCISKQDLKQKSPTKEPSPMRLPRLQEIFLPSDATTYDDFTRDQMGLSRNGTSPSETELKNRSPCKFAVNRLF